MYFSNTFSSFLKLELGTMLHKKLPWGKNAKNIVKLCYQAQKLTLSAFFCFDLQSCVNNMFYKLGCKCMTAILIDKETRHKGKIKNCSELFGIY